MSARHIPLEGNLNLRDLGGYVSEAGGSVRHGCLFRSDELHLLTDADLAVLAEDVGIRVVFDLRNESERSQRPSRLPPDIVVHVRESPSHSTGEKTFEEVIAAGELPEPDEEEFGRVVYVDLLTRLAPELGRIVELAVDAPQRPLLFHCFAGKDRTGITAAVLLGLLGVPDETIVDDYELTTQYYTDARLASVADLLDEHGIEHARVRPFFEARGRVLEIAIEHLRATWGDFDGYAVDQLGLAPDTPELLRESLLI